jgi:hypothetical protein
MHGNEAERAVEGDVHRGDLVALSGHRARSHRTKRSDGGRFETFGKEPRQNTLRTRRYR